ncbi:MAG TPA: hypothetical protein VNW92_23505 [Polyangiaceae bacterium]|jgi:hypothetical protein|nr:hypothetical protein [Polyangiaceae bacterium]
MADDPIFSDKDVFEQAGAGLVATLTVAAANSGAPLPVQGAMLMAGSLIGLGFGRSVYRAATRRYPRFANGFLSALDADPEQAGKKAKAASEQESFAESLDEIMMRSFRMMMDAVDEAVVPVLGYMAGRYTFEQKRPDVFFRSLGRLLCDLEAGEIGSLRLIVNHVCKQSNQREIVSLEIDNAGRVWAWLGTSSGLAPDTTVPGAARIFALLKREHLATTPQPAGLRYGTVDQAADVTMRMRPDIATSLLQILEPGQPSAAT